MDTITQSKLLEMIEILASKLGTTAERLWIVLLYQARIDAVTSIMISLFMIVSFVICGKWIRAEISKLGPHRDIDDNPLLLVVTLLYIIIVAVFILIATAGGIGSVVTGLINPEFAALRYILSYVNQ